VLCDALVQDVPGREAELRLEDQHDPEREDEQPDDQARRTGDVAAAHTRMRLRYSPNGLNGFGLVEKRTPFVSR